MQKKKKKKLLGKLDSYMQKNELITVPNTIHKNKLKMDSRPRYKTRHYKTPRGKPRQFDDFCSDEILLFSYILYI